MADDLVGGPPPPDPKLHEDEVVIDDRLVRQLVSDQFPAFSGLPLSRLASTGTDLAVYRLGDELVVRLPRIAWAVAQVGKERRWLGHLGPGLPAALPEVVAVGRPGRNYPFPFLVSRWLAGSDLLHADVEDWDALADELAGFVRALWQLEPPGPAPGARGGPLAPHDEDVRRAVASLAGEIDAGRALALWEEATAAPPWAGEPVWVHGDLLPGNVIVEAGRLAGVVDWGSAGLGDPACDMMIAWSLPLAARRRFRTALGVDDATWLRGRGWTLQQAVLFIPYYARTIPDGVEAARRRLGALLVAAELS